MMVQGAGGQATVQYSGQPTGPGGSRLVGFPGTAPSTVTSQGPRPTFPAYGASAPEEPKKPALIATTGSSSKIVHPPEDLSLEELRAELPQYKGAPPPPHPHPQDQQQQQQQQQQQLQQQQLQLQQLQQQQLQQQSSMASMAQVQVQQA